LFCVIVGTGVVGERDEYGVAHLTLLSLEVLGLTLLASCLTRSRVLAWVIIAGCLFDLCFGILLQAHIESMENEPGKTVFKDVQFSNSVIGPPDPGPDDLTFPAWKNWLGKHRRALYDRWLRELPVKNANDQVFQQGWPKVREEFLRLQEENEEQWGGWFSRHNGEITYVGDHITGRVGERIPVVVLLALLAGLTLVLIRQFRLLSPTSALR
jgi:hypothetical protein